MYQATYTSPPQPYGSPTPRDPYRSSPIAMPTKQPYTTTTLPPSQYPRPYQPQQPNTYQPPRHTNPHAPAQPQQLPPAKHKGTLAPGQIVQVGEHAVKIERYLSEGGYAHVYLTSSEGDIYPPVKGGGEARGKWGKKGFREHCLKRIAFQDESVWADVRKEIEVMKALPPNPHLTQYLGSAHSKLPNGGYEVFILMEFCSGGGIIDLLNKRLRDRLKEIEILNIFTDVCEAVAAMHHLSRPLLHRDLKIENVLAQPLGAPPSPQRPTPLTFKLCDFGSTTFPATHPPSTKLEADALALDLNKNTTLQYRSPEMVEPMLGWAVGLPSDVWALGVLLYKLCYYTTPFEEHGTLAIVNAKYTFPQYPVYSPAIQHLIASMLIEQPMRRPSVFEILKVAHDMSGTRPEVEYDTPAPASNKASQIPPQSARPPPATANLLDFTSPTSSMDSAPVMQPTLATTVQPGRRGRPTREQSSTGKQPQFSSDVTPPQPLDAMSPRPTHNPIASSKPQLPNLQVTGERKPESVKQPPLDAFGLPSMSAPQRSGSGFGDAFAMPKLTSTLQNGASRFGPTLQRPGSGLGGYSGNARPNTGSLPQKSTISTASSPVAQFPVSFGAPKTTSPQRKSPAPSSSIPQGEQSFETRFPSIESLSGDAFEPPLPVARPPSTQPPTQPPTLISPVTSPPMPPRQPSIMGSLTGGAGGNYQSHQLQPTKTDGAPLPRSTHVTGTAFKGIQGGLLSPSAAKGDYFPISDVGQKDGKISPVPTSSSSGKAATEDFMTGVGHEEMTSPLLRPNPSLVPSSSGTRPLPRAPTPAETTSQTSSQPIATGHSRPLLPHLNSVKPSSNINSEQWSPLEQMRQGVKPTPSKIDSSDEDEGPEDASAAKRRISPVLNTAPSTSAISASSPVKVVDRLSTFSAKPPISTKPKPLQRDRSPIKSATSPIPPSSAVEVPRPVSIQRGMSNQGRSRPVSMFASSSSTSINNLLSPPATSSSNAGLPPKSAPERPSHIRKGSITEMVSKFEGLNSSPAPVRRPSAETGMAPPKSTSSTSLNGNGLARKPSVATKPINLSRKNDTQASQPPSSSSSPNITTSPTKLPNTIKSPPPPTAKPEILRPQAVRHGDAPTAPAYSRSSSGRAFPVVKPKPTLPNVVKDKEDIKTVEKVVAVPGHGAGKGVGGGSPEKQQPVNLLIQRWNQGEVGKAGATGGGGGAGGGVGGVKKGGYI